MKLEDTHLTNRVSTNTRKRILKSTQHKRTVRIGWLFILPGLLFHIVAVTIPLLLTLYLPLTKWNGVGLPKFTGLDNFIRLFKDNVVYISLMNNFIWTAFSITVPILLALVLARLLTKAGRLQTLYQAIFFSTSVMTVTVAGQIWISLLNPFSGINYYLEKAGLGFLSMPGLTIPSLSIFFILIAEMWRSFGTNVIWLLAAMTQTDKSLEECAKIEGASKLQMIWHVVLPQLRPTVTMLVLITVLGSFSAFEMVYVMTKGGPSHATETLSTYSYLLSTANREAGYGSAVSFIQFVVSVGLIAIYANLRRKKGWDI